MRRLAAAALLACFPAHALELKPKAEVEARWFSEAPGAPLLGAVGATLEVFQPIGESQRISGEFFQRWDEHDSARTHGDVRELYWQQVGGVYELRIGARRVFWGVTESRHLVDIVNQSDFVENVDAEDKLGQPMVNLALIPSFGTLDLFVMPYQRARTFAGREGYPRLPLQVHAHEARYESADAQEHLDYAARYAGSFGPLDVGLSWFDGTAREPRLLPCLRRGARDANGDPFAGTADGPNCTLPESSQIPAQMGSILTMLGVAPSAAQAQAVFDNLVLVPQYDLLRQGGVDAQVVFGNLALKVEGAWREQQGRETRAAVSGFEYTFGDLWATGADLGVIGEYLYDERGEFLGVLLDDEVFVGGRLAINDVAGSQLLAGVVGSRKRFENRLYGVEASRRLSDDWRLAIETRIFSKFDRSRIEGFLADQDFTMLTLERFF
ncbi:MAG TPA: hypothetical protein VM240_09910 [Verrucomicrobiae bacterium]|nr:hypothetical protein [Verrucomicrobiae bacterium]